MASGCSNLCPYRCILLLTCIVHVVLPLNDDNTLALAAYPADCYGEGATSKVSTNMFIKKGICLYSFKNRDSNSKDIIGHTLTLQLNIHDKHLSVETNGSAFLFSTFEHVPFVWRFRVPDGHAKIWQRLQDPIHFNVSSFILKNAEDGASAGTGWHMLERVASAFTFSLYGDSLGHSMEGEESFGATESLKIHSVEGGWYFDMSLKLSDAQGATYWTLANGLLYT
ncbi:hypothetical protein FOZ62_028049 [Perkinsus olseni]|uniref:Uncharacterized protein n=1 Tax=Perkinsus olseni TaxID=32597 RepID=A0A7J6QDV9_PEROL|nr:hypothetical protein FOZ62_028049 [Perkinsus olseni]